MAQGAGHLAGGVLSEVRARELGRWVGGTWRASAAGKVSVVLVGAICFAVILGAAYLLLFAG
jgi:hypothetical protein